TTLDDEFTDFASWYVFEVPFAADETVVMTHSYNMDLPGDNSGYCVMSYILETGAGWKDTIKHSVIMFDISMIESYGVFSIYGNSHTREYKEKMTVPLGLLRYEDGKIVYENWDFEPTHNLEVHFSVYAIIDHWDTDRRTPRDWESLAFFDDAENLDHNELVTAYNNLSYNNKLMETLYLNTKLGMPPVEYPPVAVSIKTYNNEGTVVYIKDSNFNMKPYCEFSIIDENGTVMKHGEMKSWQSFGNYGTMEYYSGEFALRNDYQYIITAYDYAGNTSSTIFDIEGNVIYQSINGVIFNDNITNPETNESPLYLVWSLICSAVGLMMLGFKLKCRPQGRTNEENT
ncbi:MAG: hypothetical protein R3232_00230, partial [Clostridia bacterium]|nr:hypothetical protein [Clostridia bacterium]